MRLDNLPPLFFSIDISKLKLLLFIVCIFIYINSINAVMLINQETLQYEFPVNLALLDEINWNNIEQHIRYLSSLGSRLTGSPGCELAADYISEKFREYGLNVSLHEFNVTVPVNYGTSITLLNYPELQLTLHPLLPNLVVTNTVKNLTAPIVYIGDGDYEKMNGKKVQDCIILMDFNNHGRWMLPVKFGAKAIIFIEPDITTKEEIDKNHATFPIYIPRFYISKEDALKLLNIINKSNKPVIASITCDQRWEIKVGRNIIGRLEGKTYANRTMIICSFYDSYSIVPTIAPGANDAAGIASLLEIARIFSKLPKPDYTILFIAWSGHYQGLAGSRSFVEDIIWNRKPTPGNSIGERFHKSEISLWIERVVNLALTTRSAEWALTDIGDFYGHTVPPTTPMTTGNVNLYNYLSLIVDRVSGKTGVRYLVSNAHTTFIGAVIGTAAVGAVAAPTRRVFPKGLLPWDHEPFAQDSLAMAVTLATVDPMQYAFNPIDTFENVNLQNLRCQLETIIPIVYDLTFTPNNFITYLKNINQYTEPLNYVYRRTITVLGRVATFNKTLAWYSPIPDSLVAVKVFFAGAGENWEHQDYLIVATDENGAFRIPMLQIPRQMVIMAFKVNPDTGKIEYGPDMGMYEYVFTRPISETVLRRKGLFCDLGFLTVFRCGTAIIFDFIDPETGSSADMHRSVSILDAMGDAPTESFGVIIEGDNAILFLPTDINVKITLHDARLGRIPLGVLLNNSIIDPIGNGYKFITGDQYIFTNTPLQISKNLLNLFAQYSTELSAFQIEVSYRIEELKNHIKKIEVAIDSTYYNEAYIESLKAWSKILRAYIDIRNTKIDIINGIPFFSMLLVLFVPLLQQLILPIYGGKRIIILVILFAIFLLLLYIIHPGFRLASNSFIVVISVMLIILTMPSCSILITSLSWGTKKIAKKISGLHKIETGRLNVASLSLSVGIENIRKRKLRSFLILITITLTVASLVTFVSISSVSMPTFQRIPFEPPYTGIFIKQVEWIYPLDYEFVEALKCSLEARGLLVMPRAVLYTTHPTATNPTIPYFIRNLEMPEKIAEIYAAIGLPPETLDFFENLKESIIEGRWFTCDDEWTCILSDKIAEKLCLTKLPGKITFIGKNFTVIGIIDSKMFDNIWDINVESLTPWDARLPEQDFIHAPSSEVLIVDYNSLLYFNPNIASISVKCRNVEEARNLTAEIFTEFGRLKIWSGFDKETVVISRERQVAVHGFEMQLPILVISALMIFNIMFGSIYERRKDIYTFSTVGASPFHVIIIFLGEALMFSIISGMLGYLLATLLIRSIVSHMLFTMNYASTWVITAIGIAMLVVMLSAIYPLIIASKMVTPSLERVWKIPTKPREDIWEIPLPFVFSIEEIDGVCAFITEYLRTHIGEGSTDFSIANLIYKEEQLKNQLIRKITFIARLAPYEFGVLQDVNIIFSIPQDSDVWRIMINLYRKAGPRDVWEKNNRKFIDILRKQLLLWRTLKYEDKRIYMMRFPKLLGDEKYE